MFFFFFFKQKTAYEMCGRDWSSDVCSSDLVIVIIDVSITSHGYIDNNNNSNSMTVRL